MYTSECFIINTKNRKEVEKVLNKLDNSYEVLFKAPQTYAYTAQLQIAKESLTDDLKDVCILVAPEEVYIERSLENINLEAYLSDFYSVAFVSGYNGLVKTLANLEKKVVVNHCKSLCSCMKELKELK